MGRVAGSVAGVFTGFRSDNNHYLNTLYLQAVGADAGPLAIRGMAVASGIATIVVAVAAGARDRMVALTWAFLLSFSGLVVHYASEARGYSVAVLLAVICFVAMERILEEGRAAWGVAFGIAAALGILSHLTFVYVLAAFMAWAVATALRDRDRLALGAALAAAFAPPVLLLGLLWAVDLRHLIVGGGPEYQLGGVLRELSRHALGIPEGVLEWMALPVLALAGVAYAALLRARDLRWVFFAVAIVVGPAMLLLLSRPKFLAPRYFLVLVPFLLWLVADGLVRLARARPVGTAVAGTLAVLFLVGNAAAIRGLLRDGRGQYLAALEFIVQNEDGPVAKVTSDGDGRNFPLIDYHRFRLAQPERIQYVPENSVLQDMPTWVLAHRFASAPPPARIVLGPTGRRYDLLRVFPSGSLSGWEWWLYRLAPSPDGH